MCDCYEHACKICGELLPVHLGDYQTKRHEIEVFCRSHIPKSDVRIFTITEPTVEEINNKKRRYKIGWKMGIRYLTENAKKNKEINHPNLGADWEIEDIE